MAVGGNLATVKAYMMGEHDWDSPLWPHMAAENEGQEDLMYRRIQRYLADLLIFPNPYLFDPNQQRPPVIKPIVRPKPSRPEDDKETIVVKNDCVYRSIIYYRYSPGCKIFR